MVKIEILIIKNSKLSFIIKLKTFFIKISIFSLKFDDLAVFGENPIMNNIRGKSYFNL